MRFWVLRIGRRIPAVVLDHSSVVFLDGRQGIPNHCQRSVSQKIDFDQARILCLILFPLNDAHALGCRFDRHVRSTVSGAITTPPQCTDMFRG